ncbi:MAG: methyltransferase domain-containing protein [Desulfurellales bacterium]|nr:MAG: methyltransferase domain-containing protein [Desulfurellales bacterium]
MHASVRAWVAQQLPLIAGPRVIELGSLDVNGTIRDQVAVLKPTEYVGVDLRGGAEVDVVCDVCSGFLRDYYGQFDFVISTETLEHVQSWPLFVHEMKRLATPGGHLLLTCRGPGFELHEYPGDYWRFTPDDLQQAFDDCEVVACEPDPRSPGAFVHAIKPQAWSDSGPKWLTVAGV